MGAIMLVTGVWYVQRVAAQPDTPIIGSLVPYVLAVIVLSIIAQTILAILSPKEAEAHADERERIVIDRAGNWSGIVLGLGVVIALVTYIGGSSATLLAHSIVAALIVAQLADCLFQIFLLRRAV
ncbi:MAG: hypothetical protein G9473_03745 [Erythrobacter sp.]|nr:MAG: hypothetical protein G9473_03745 [Erythrobacter sp.]